MKQKDIALIVVVVIVSGVFSVVLSSFLIGSPSKQKQMVEVVEPISSEFNSPNSKYFNERSINPTQTITIGDNTNPQPFNQ